MNIRNFACVDTSIIKLDIAGPGFIVYSPFAAESIWPGEDYIQRGFFDPAQVEKQALEGRIVGVSTGTPGRFFLKIHEGYPPNEMLSEYNYRLRLGVEVRDGTLCVRDLYDLIKWMPKCPLSQCIDLDDGFYHITLLSRDPASGVLGQNQDVLMYLNKLGEMPKLKYKGVPTLCP